jgi:hypothetical protein
MQPPPRCTSPQSACEANPCTRETVARWAPGEALSTLTGAGAAFALTAVAAARYGRNEGAESCGACLVQWSTMTVPIGAAAGALIGFAIDKANVRTVFARATAGRSSLSITPLVARNTFGGFATIRF